MALIFLIGFFTAAAFVRSRTNFSNRLTVSAIVIYFVCMEEPIAQFFFVPFTSWIYKAGLFVLIILPLLIGWRLIAHEIWWRMAAAAGICYLVLLPFSTPTIWFNPIGASWKVHMFPIRFAENTSRLPAIQVDAKILNEHCEMLDPSVRSVLTAHVRNLEFLTSECKEAVARQRTSPGNTPDVIARLNQMRNRKDRAMTQQAIDLLDSSSEETAVAAVLYLQKISGESYGNEKALWLAWSKRGMSQLQSFTMASDNSSDLSQRGFSAIQALDDVYSAEATSQDFVHLYLAHFPKSTSSDDVQFLQKNIAELSCSTPRCHYKKGMVYFFLALTQTKLLANGDPVEVQQSWQSALKELQISGPIGDQIQVQIQKSVDRADANHDGALSREELMTLIGRGDPVGRP